MFDGVILANSKRKCVYCPKYAPAESGIVTPVGFFCSFDHAAKHAQAKRDKQRADKPKIEAKAARKAKREYYDNDRSHQLKLTQATFNGWIRFRDAGEPCISCGRNTGAKVNAGHYLSVGSHPELRFNSLNVWLQCEHCNMFKSGNIGEYRPRLIDKIGLELVEWLEGPHEPKKYTCEQLKEIRAYYAKLTRLGIKTDEDRPHK